MQVYFKEKQHFKQPWLWVLLVGINGLFIYGIVRQLIIGKDFGNKPLSNTMLLAITLSVIALTLAFLLLRLETIICGEGIFYRFFPFQTKLRHITWHSTTQAYVRKYNAITEFGGWGLRWALKGKVKALTVAGNIGLLIEYDNGKKLLLGTQKEKEMAVALAKVTSGTIPGTEKAPGNTQANP